MIGNTWADAVAIPLTHGPMGVKHPGKMKARRSASSPLYIALVMLLCFAFGFSCCYFVNTVNQPWASDLSAGVPVKIKSPDGNTKQHVDTIATQILDSQAESAATQAVLLASHAWRPMFVRACAPGMSPQYAPCLPRSSNIHNLELSEEVIYPDFAVRSPHYLHQDHAVVIEKHLQVRFRRERRGNGPYWYYYLNQHGRNLVFDNVIYNPGDPPADWTTDGSHCMGGTSSKHEQFSKPAVSFAPADAASIHTSVMFAASPDSYSFQHWSDRVAMMLAQTETLRDNHTKYIAMQPRSQSVVSGWKYLANITSAQTQLLHPGEQVRARSFIFACDTPLIHPYLMQRVSEMMLAGAGLDPAGASLDDRKVVLLATRMNDQHAHNGGRRWLNYKECVPKIQQLLEQRKQGEQLEVWDSSRFQNHAEAMEFWSRKVRAVIGTHGGALYNVQYATSPTMVLEIWPVTSDGQKALVPTPNVIWEICSTKGLQHWALPVQIERPGSSDVNVDCNLIVSALAQHLGKTYEPVIKPFYQGTTWSA